MSLCDHLRHILFYRLDAHRIVVWYDGERAFGEFVRAFQSPHCRVILAEPSALQARREAEVVYRGMEESTRPDEIRANLLIYIPVRRAPEEGRARDPFEVFAAAGTVFGEAEGERLQSLARAAMPELVEQIDGVFLTGRPTLALLDNLKLTSAYPLVQQALGVQGAVEVIARLLGSTNTAAKLHASHADAELLDLLRAELGFTPGVAAQTAKTVRAPLARYVLLSELALDLPDAWPEALAGAPHAEPKHRDRVLAICQALRDSDGWREAYLEWAAQVEAELRLDAVLPADAPPTEHETFAFLEKRDLAAFVATLLHGDPTAARAILDARRASIWRRLSERDQLWRLAERALDLLTTAGALADPRGRLPDLIRAYTAKGGWSDLDRQQRLLEQSYADCAGCEEVLPVVELARRTYRESIGRLQARFLEGVQSDGWPTEGMLRQTQVFERFVAPALERRQKVAYVLADSLRFEMGRALAGELASLGEVQIQPAAASLPTITAVGMAALLPGADGALSLRLIGDAYMPHLGDRPLKDSAARMAWLKEKYGDRFVDVTLDQWLDASEKRRTSWAATADLLVLRVPDIDELGESVSLRQARKHMSGLLGELKSAAIHLARAGYGSIVIAADHGHVLLPEVLPGDTISRPDGEWGLSKRRSQLGARFRDRAGALFFKPGRLGIQTDAPDYCVPSGFSVFASDANYFHEGLSLQECLVPVIELKPSGRPAAAGKPAIEIRYGRDRFTSQVIGLKIHNGALFGEPLRVRVQAYDAGDPKGPPVGEAADCAARDENTHEVTLKPNVETEVPVLISPDFHGEAVEIRASAPDGAVVWARLKLKNGIMD